MCRIYVEWTEKSFGDKGVEATCIPFNNPESGGNKERE